MLRRKRVPRRAKGEEENRVARESFTVVKRIGEADILRMTSVVSRLGLQQLLLGLSLLIEPLLGYNVLMATMGGTKSHTVPFVALGTNLRSRGHNVTLLSAFPGPAANNGLHELVPSILEVIYNLPRTSVSPCSRRRNPGPPCGIFTASRARPLLSSSLALDPYLISLHTE